MGHFRIFYLLICTLFTAFSGTAAAETHPYPVPQFASFPLTPDGGHLLEGTQVAPQWSWHARLDAKYHYGVGTAERASQFIGNFSFGLGVFKQVEVALALPFGWTVGAHSDDLTIDHRRYLVGMEEDGPGIGNLSAAVLVSAYDSSDGGFGLLVGLLASAPTGTHGRLLGEGGFAVEPFIVAAFQLFGTRLSLNLSYRIRPEHRLTIADQKYEQDDDLRWKLGLRIPKKYDVTWSLELEGAIGFATFEGAQPSPESRPVGLAAGVDFPVSRNTRLGMLVGGGFVGHAIPRVTIGVHFSWLPTLPDEDGDGLSGYRDACPLLREDLDSFEDNDGCPDLDNDQDGFPDDEDQCPEEPGDDFSENGC